MPTEGAKKVRLVAAVEGPDPTGTYKAGVVSGALPYVAAGCPGPTREQALGALAARLAEVGYDADITAFDGAEAAADEVRRRRAAEDLLRPLAPPYGARLAELLPHRPDAVEALGDLTEVLSSAAQGRDLGEPPLIRRSPPPPRRPQGARGGGGQAEGGHNPRRGAGGTGVAPRLAVEVRRSPASLDPIEPGR